jgi:hypothetical protein
MKTPINSSGCLTGHLLLIHGDGAETDLIIRIGMPIRRGGDWASPCEIANLEPQYEDIVGADAVHSICLALKLIRSRLLSLIAKGNNLCLPNDKHHPLSAAFVSSWFGVD